MIIAAGQTVPHREDVTANLEDHYKFVEVAAENKVQLIIFPEMSITGYEHELAPRQAFTMNDSRLNKLRELSSLHKIIIVAGAPVKENDQLFIGSFVIFPDGRLSLYTKQFLHEGEDEVFNSSFDYNPSITLAGEQITLAICADIENIHHPENACQTNTSLYLASIFYSPKGIDGAHQLLGRYARIYKMNVLMSNFGGESWGMASGGKSAFWDKNGRCIAGLADDREGLVVVEKVNGEWKEKAVAFLPVDRGK